MDSDLTPLSDEQLLRINQLCNEFEAAWKAGQQPRVEPWLQDLAPDLRGAAISELLTLELEYRRRAGHAVSLEELTTRFPDARRAWLQELSEPADRAIPSDIPETLGDYRILERIGSGGMGTVYKAVHQRMGRTVALKVLQPEIQRDPALLQRFDREVRAAARLTHPNIVAALDAREQDGLHYLITEFVAGSDLDETVRQQGPLPIGEAVDCIVQAARGLDYAHRQGVVHRDIKPANLLRDNDGVVKILDMGLARLDAAEDPGAANLTRSGMVMGTAAYMSPEQARNTHRADARSDIYSLGCTLYFLLTGRPMFSGESVVDTILSHASLPVPALNGNNARVPAGLDRVFQRMVAKDPRERFQTAAEVVAALEPFADASAVRAGSPPTIAIEPHGTSSSAATVLLPSPIDVASSTAVSVNTPRRSVRGLIVTAAAIIGLGILVASAIKFIPSPDDARRDTRTTTDQFALQFNGQSSYVAVRKLEPTADATYTIELIAQPQTEPSTQPANLVSWLGPNWMAIYLDGSQRWGVARLWRGASRLKSTSTAATLGAKVHLAGIFDGGDLRLFINGESLATDTAEFPLSETSGGLFIGGADLARLPDERFFRGQIDAVRISRGVRYTNNFTPPAQLQADSDTLALFPFTEGRGETTRSSDGVWSGEIVNATWQRIGR